MRKRMLVLTGTVLLLTLVLAIPASASKPTDIWYTEEIEQVEIGCQTREVGNRCFVTFQETGKYYGAIEGDWVFTYSTLTKGSCNTGYEGCGPGPGAWAETWHGDEIVTGSVLGRSGTFRDRCQGIVRSDGVLVADCVIQSGTGDLAGLRGILKHSSTDEEMWGQVHFEPDK